MDVESTRHGTIPVYINDKGWATFQYGDTSLKMAAGLNSVRLAETPLEAVAPIIAQLDRVPINRKRRKPIPKQSTLSRSKIGEDAILRCWYKELRAMFADAYGSSTPDNVKSYFIARGNYRQLCRLRGLPVDYRAETQRDIDRRVRYQSFMRKEKPWWELIIAWDEGIRWHGESELERLAESMEVPMRFPSLGGQGAWGKQTIRELSGDLQIG